MDQKKANFFVAEDFFLTGEDIDKRAAALANAKVAPLIAENEKLKDANCWSCEDKEKIRKLTEQNRIMKEALEFYSGTVEKQVEIWDKSLLIDRGDKAREVLAKCKEAEK